MTKSTFQKNWRALEKASIFKIIEWILFIFLCGISVYFMLGVLNAYFSKQTSFSLSNEPITKLPTILLCFSSNGKFDGDVNYEYGSEFKISYEVDWKKSIGFLKEGENFNDFNETVNIERIRTVYTGTCYKVSSLSNFVSKGKFTSLFLHFDTSIPTYKLPYVKFYFSSEENLLGILFAEWFDGKVKPVQIEKDLYKLISLQPIRYNHLRSKSNCREESFFECLRNIIYEKLDHCPKKCSDYYLPSLPICETEQESQCSEKVFFEVWRSVRRGNQSNLCPMPCTYLEYSKEETWTGKISDFSNGTLGIAYIFTPELVAVYDKYLIYNEVSMIASVGGTLGMCIGFSFTNVVSCIINFIRYKIAYIQNILSFYL